MRDEHSRWALLTRTPTSSSRGRTQRREEESLSFRSSTAPIGRVPRLHSGKSLTADSADEIRYRKDGRQPMRLSLCITPGTRPAVERRSRRVFAQVSDLPAVQLGYRGSGESSSWPGVPVAWPLCGASWTAPVLDGRSAIANPGAGAGADRLMLGLVDQIAGPLRVRRGGDDERAVVVQLGLPDGRSWIQMSRQMTHRDGKRTSIDSKNGPSL